MAVLRRFEWGEMRRKGVCLYICGQLNRRGGDDSWAYAEEVTNFQVAILVNYCGTTGGGQYGNSSSNGLRQD